MQLNKNTRYKLIRLTDEIKSLEAVKEKILTRISRETLGLKQLPEEMCDEEKYYFSSWSVDEGIEKINSIMLHLGGPLERDKDLDNDRIQYLKVTSVCEYPTRRKKDERGQILPKKQRLNTEETDVIFVYHNEDVYVIAFTTEHYSLLRVKRLIGETFISSETNTNNLTPDLFHWLFYRYIKNKRNLGRHINLESIAGFTGIVMTNDHVFEGKSDQMADLIVTKAFISSGYPIKSIKVRLYSGNGMITFFVNEDDDLYVERGSNIDLPLLRNEEDIAMPIFLFFILLPELRKLYELDTESFIGGEKLKFNAEIGKQVIISIAEKNGIDLDLIRLKSDC
ncbi:hypothetical protein GMB51_15350 [Turicibacter sanguinis]|nr:hypothetical protein [Turicibacter sanguinis]MTN52065.1 hypothetical protein [Turicibacter sanguinis]MTN54957.1 hypothetical protein [Turicibacter sanguinis]MTN58526.1 hypothetical protein [Turicibacter sanguinis]MTN61420.1 hypothetical protein [Turicibacter sanguinis]